MTLTELVARLEAVSGPDRSDDGWIEGIIVRGWMPPYPLSATVPYYTKSLDAAVALAEKMLPGQAWQVTRRTSGCVSAVTIDGRFAYSKAATPALALCLAVVRALIEKEKTDA